MKYLFIILTFITEIVSQEYNYKINNKKFKCDIDTMYNLKYAIANELNISYMDVDIYCNNNVI